jgi:hypothetical protein
LDDPCEAIVRRQHFDRDGDSVRRVRIFLGPKDPAYVRRWSQVSSMASVSSGLDLNPSSFNMAVRMN